MLKLANCQSAFSHPWTQYPHPLPLHTPIASTHIYTYYTHIHIFRSSKFVGIKLAHKTTPYTFAPYFSVSSWTSNGELFISFITLLTPFNLSMIMGNGSHRQRGRGLGDNLQLVKRVIGGCCHLKPGKRTSACTFVIRPQKREYQTKQKMWERKDREEMQEMEEMEKLEETERNREIKSKCLSFGNCLSSFNNPF